MTEYQRLSLGLLVLSSLQDGRHESSAAAGSVLGEEKVELVVDPHHLGYPALHHVLEVGVEPEN